MVSVYTREGSPNWYARLRDPRVPGGEDRRSTNTRDRAKAEEVAADLQAKIDREIAGLDGLRWLDAAEDFLARAKLKDQTHRGYSSLVAVITRSSLGNFNMKMLAHDDIKRFVKERRQAQVLVYDRATQGTKPTRKGRRVSDASIKRSLSVLSAIFDWSIAQDLHGAPSENVVSSYDRSGLTESKPHDRHLRPAQFIQILDSLKNEEHKRILIVLVGTGMRSSELLTLQWGEVDMPSQTIEFGNLDPDKTKNSKSRRIPMSAVVLKALAAQKTAQRDATKRYPKLKDTRYVFANRLTGEPRVHLGYLGKRVKRMSGIKSYRNHDLRHTFGSWAIQQQIDLIALSKVMGHSDLSTTSRYAKHIDDTVAAQYRRMQVPETAQPAAQSSGFAKTEKRNTRKRR